MPEPDSRLTPAKLLKSLRAFSLPVSVLPVFLAVAAAVPLRRWDWAVLLASAAGAGLLHLAGNLLNDYFDFRAGVDRRLEDDAGRPGRLLVTGELTPRAILVEALVCLALAAAAAAWLTWRSGPGIVAFGAGAVVLLYSYTGPPLRLKYHALGEVVIFVVFGPMLMVGAAWAQTRGIELPALLLSIPVGLATTAILVGNNYRDRQEDGGARIRTLGHLAGGRVSRGLYVGLVVAAGVVPAGLALVRLAPWALLAAPLALGLLAEPLAAMRSGRRLADIDARTARFETALLLLMIAGCLL